MNREDIIRMAREVGIEFDPRWGTCYTGNVQLERFAALVAAAEREACAKVCDEREEIFQKYYIRGLPGQCASAIRARGQL
jgi:hypothetical protein